MKNLRFSVFTFISLLSVSAFAMDEPAFTPLRQRTIHIPEPFPGHDSSPILGTVQVTNVFNPQDYQEDDTRNQGVCKFNSMLAGIMRTDYGRRKVQDLIKWQDDRYVYIGFYFPPPDILKNYDGYLEEIKNVQAYVNELDEDPAPDYDEITLQFERLNKIFSLWKKAIDASQTVLQVPKNFVTRSDLVKIPNFPHPIGSFPQQNPEWLNLIQQAYMGLTKNFFLRNVYSRGGYFDVFNHDEEIQEQDAFWGVPFCYFDYVRHENVKFPKRSPGPCNIITDKPPLHLFPLIDIPLKSFNVHVNEEGEVDLNGFYDVKEKGFEKGTQIFKVHPYNSIVDFASTHGLSKDLLMASNVVSFVGYRHNVALFFGEGKVHYYDNAYWPPQTAVYGNGGPIFEEAFHFKGKNINDMGEEEFLTCLFKEITYRLEQARKVKAEEFAPKTTLYFFEKPLI